MNIEKLSQKENKWLQKQTKAKKFLFIFGVTLLILWFVGTLLYFRESDECRKNILGVRLAFLSVVGAACIGTGKMIGKYLNIVRKLTV